MTNPATDSVPVRTTRGWLRSRRGVTFSAGLSMAVALGVGVLAVAPSASAATTVAYTTARLMGSGSSTPAAPTPGQSISSSYGDGGAMALDSAGNLYVGDALNGVIDKIAPDGTLSVFAGGAGVYSTSTPALNATIAPSALVFDAAGDLYVGDSTNANIYKITMATGAITTIAGTGTATSNTNGLPTFGGQASTTDLASVDDLAVSAAGDLYIADSAGAVEKIDRTSGVLSLVAGSLLGSSGGAPPVGTTPTSATAVNVQPQGLGFAPDGALYIGESVTVSRLTTDGMIRVVAGNQPRATVMRPGPALSSPIPELSSLRVDPVGNVYVGTSNQIGVIDRAGDLQVIAGDGSYSAPTFGVASTSSASAVVDALVIAPDGAIYTNLAQHRYVVKLVNSQPALPTAVTATAGNTSASVSWTAPAGPGTSAITGYTVTPYLAGVAQTPVTVSASATTTVVSSLTNGSAYTFTVAAINASGVGDASRFSAAVTPTAPPAGGGGGGGTPALTPQTIAATTPSGVSVGGFSPSLAATTSSGLPLTYASSTSSVCTVSASGVVRPVATGTCSITVSQAGNATYAPATKTVTFAIAASPEAGPDDAASALPLGATRLSGQSRVGTSVAISNKLFADGKSQAVVIATSNTFADSIAGARLAALERGPLLLTGTAALDDSVASEVRRLVTTGGSVYVLGQTAALSGTVSQALEDLSSDYSVTRLGGTDRYATAVAIADQVTSKAGDTGPIYLVNGTVFADGVATSALAAHTGGVVLLTNDKRMPAQTAAYLAAHDSADERTIPVGGASATATTDAGLRAASGRAVVGADRYATAAALATKFSTGNSSSTGSVATIGVATGTNWPDALTGAAAMGALRGPLLLTSATSLPAATSGALGRVSSTITRGVVFGGTAAIDDTTYGQIAALIPAS